MQASKVMRLHNVILQKCFLQKPRMMQEKRYIELLESSANGGCATAQYSLGYYYSTIDSLDLKKAILWYEKGAEQNHAQSQCNLADKYEHGIGVDQNYGKAIHLYKMSAE